MADASAPARSGPAGVRRRDLDQDGHGVAPGAALPPQRRLWFYRGRTASRGQRSGRVDASRAEVSAAAGRLSGSGEAARQPSAQEFDPIPAHPDYGSASAAGDERPRKGSPRSIARATRRPKCERRFFASKLARAPDRTKAEQERRARAEGRRRHAQMVRERRQQSESDQRVSSAVQPRAENAGGTLPSTPTAQPRQIARGSQCYFSDDTCGYSATHKYITRLRDQHDLAEKTRAMDPQSPGYERVHAAATAITSEALELQAAFTAAAGECAGVDLNSGAGLELEDCYKVMLAGLRATLAVLAKENDPVLKDVVAKSGFASYFTDIPGPDAHLADCIQSGAR